VYRSTALLAAPWKKKKRVIDLQNPISIQIGGQAGMAAAGGVF
jgi:hypothetical protein